MADLTSYRSIDVIGVDVVSRYPFKYRDMGDGTWAEVVAAIAVVGTGASYTTAGHTNVNVNGNTNIIAANGNRKYLLIVNDSDTVIYLAFGGNATVPVGIRLNASGGSYEMSAQEGNLYTGAIYANHGGGAVDKVLLLTEGI
jgi:hypothetical protein